MSEADQVAQLLADVKRFEVERAKHDAITIAGRQVGKTALLTRIWRNIFGAR